MAGANDRPPDRAVRIPGNMPSEYLAARAEAFANATNRKGMPLTWGTGEPRKDKAWLKDQARRGKGVGKSSR
jgi:hypothetical protein